MKLQGIELNEWTNPRTGEVRYYVNNLAEIIGLEVKYYSSGNIASATLKGEHISNTKASRAVSNLKVWLNADGEIFTQGGSEFSEEIVAAIKAAQTAATETDEDEGQDLLDWAAITAANDPEFGVRIEKFLPATTDTATQYRIENEVYRHLGPVYEELAAQHYGRGAHSIYGAPII